MMSVTRILTTFALFVLTAVAEIGGCYATYAWLRMGRSAWWLLPGAISLAFFAWLLTLHPTDGAGRIYAAYGGIYIMASLLWLWLVERRAPDHWDILGAAICLVGAGVILFGPRNL